MLTLLLAAGLLLAAPPTGTPGPEADALARRMEAAVDVTAWQATGAVQWTFAGKRHHLWDRQRSFVEVRVDAQRVLLDLTADRGLAWEGEAALTGEAAAKALDDAHAAWTNDAFWLNPLAKLFDAGVARSQVVEGDKVGLLVQYTAGGRTPGDAYLWWPGPDGTPTRWQLWTSNIPIGGLEATWEGWITLATGARISTRHVFPMRELALTDVQGAASLAALRPGPDPFAALVDCAGCTARPR
ncbi:MAG: hypothetical protein R3F60_16855 [bacterium]